MRWLVIVVLILCGCPGELPDHKRDGVFITDLASHDQVRFDTSPITDLGSIDHPQLDQLATDQAVIFQPDLFAPLDQGNPTVDFGLNDIGKSCISSAQCMFGICATALPSGQMFCSKGCNPCDALPCPSGIGCVATTSGSTLPYLCYPGAPNAPCNP